MMEKELQNMIDIAKAELLTATGTRQSDLLTFIQSLINATFFAKQAGLIKEEKEAKDGF